MTDGDSSGSSLPTLVLARRARADQDSCRVVFARKSFIESILRQVNREPHRPRL